MGKLLRRAALAAIVIGVLWVLTTGDAKAGAFLAAWRHAGLLTLFVVETLVVAWLMRRKPLYAAATLLAGAWVSALLADQGLVVLPLRSGVLQYDPVVAPLVAMALIATFSFMSVGEMFPSGDQG